MRWANEKEEYNCCVCSREHEIAFDEAVVGVNGTAIHNIISRRFTRLCYAIYASFGNANRTHTVRVDSSCDKRFIQLATTSMTSTVKIYQCCRKLLLAAFCILFWLRWNEQRSQRCGSGVADKEDEHSKMLKPR